MTPTSLSSEQYVWWALASTQKWSDLAMDCWDNTAAGAVAGGGGPAVVAIIPAQ
jgi:hypothetical protein